MHGSGSFGWGGPICHCGMVSNLQGQPMNVSNTDWQILQKLSSIEGLLIRLLEKEKEAEAGG